MSVTISKVLSHPFGAFVVSLGSLLILGLFSREYWVLTVTIVVAWVASDTIISWFIEHVDHGMRIRFINWRFQAQGRVYLAFFVGIIIATLASTFIAQYISERIGLLTTPDMLLGSLILTGLVYADLRGRYY